jgi:hypothetical protein
MIKFTMTRDLPFSANAFWAKFLDSDFNRRAFTAMGFARYEILELRDEPGRVLRRSAAQPALDAPAIVQKVLGPSFGYVEDGQFDRATKTWTWKATPSVLADRSQFGGTGDAPGPCDEILKSREQRAAGSSPPFRDVFALVVASTTVSSIAARRSGERSASTSASRTAGPSEPRMSSAAARIAAWVAVAAATSTASASARCCSPRPRASARVKASVSRAVTSARRASASSLETSRMTLCGEAAEPRRTQRTGVGPLRPEPNKLVRMRTLGTEPLSS